MSRAVAGPLVVVLAALLAVGACGESGTVGRTAAQRFDDAVRVIARALGKSEGEIETGLKTRLPGATIDDLATQAERSASKTTELEAIAAREAARAAEDARREAMARTVFGATCDFVDIADAIQSDTEAERWAKFREILVGKLDENGFTTTPDDVAALSQDVQDLWAEISVGPNGSPRSLDEIATDLACFAS